MRKPVLAICEKQRCRSACAFAQSDQHLCCSLLRQYNTWTYTCLIQNFKTLTSLWSWAGWFESYPVANPEDRFSRDVAYIIRLTFNRKFTQTECCQQIYIYFYVYIWSYGSCSIYLGHVMRKHVYALCEQQRRRSACASAQSDQRLCFSLPR